jgi:DNA invertase Pin-like site-specific DNA recombinase
MCNLGAVVRIHCMDKIIVYARVSTEGQNHDSQLSELREYCARRNWTHVEEIIDTVSGAKSSRKGLDRLMTLVRSRKVDIVVCYKLDRLGRSFPHLAQLIHEFDNNGVALICTSQGIDTSGDNLAGRLTMHILVAMADFERGLIKERTIAGLKAARAKGVRLGRKPTLNAHRENVARLRAQGHTGRAIAKELGIPSSSVFKLIAGL